MTTRREYTCNWCHRSIGDGSGLGLRWETNDKIQLTIPSCAETHICQKCSDQFEAALADLRRADAARSFESDDTKRHHRWAVICLKDEGGPLRSGYAYLYKSKPKNTAVAGFGRHAVACIEIEFGDGEGLTNALGSFDLKATHSTSQRDPR